LTQVKATSDRTAQNAPVSHQEMPMRSLQRLSALALLLPLFGAQAADPVTDAMLAAYEPYRVVLFRTNSKAQPESEQAIAAARQRWKGLADRFGARPPAPYDRDAAFGRTLEDVDRVYGKAEQEIRRGELAQAHETLEAARDLMAELRRRNNVVVLSDHMNAYHAQMEHVLDEGPRLVAAPQGLLQLMAHAGTLGYLAARLREEAPAALQADAEFTGAQRAVAESVAVLRQALLAQDVAATREALSRLKAPYSRLFLKFG
jgi:hypothetical protein